MVDVILQIKTDLAAVANEAQQIFGRGGDPAAESVENVLGYVNTPEVAGYVRVRIDDEAARQLELLNESANARLVRVEWPEQAPWPPYQVGLDDDGHPVYLGTIA